MELIPFRSSKSNWKLGLKQVIPFGSTTFLIWNMFSSIGVGVDPYPHYKTDYISFNGMKYMSLYAFYSVDYGSNGV